MARVLMSQSHSAGIFLLFEVLNQCTCCCLMVPLFVFQFLGYLVLSPLSLSGQQLGGYFPLACVPALFVTSVQLHCLNPWADSVFVFLWGSFSKYCHCLWLCLCFLRFSSALVHNLACKLVLCNPQCFYLAWCWQSSLWTQLQGEEHW